MTDILFVVFNRLEYTKASFTALIDHTDWDEVEGLFIADDASTDGTHEWLASAVDHERLNGVEITHRNDRFHGPVAAMNWCIDNRSVDSDRFVKIDNDFVVCPDWLPEMLKQMTINPGLDILGVQPRFGPPTAPFDWGRTIELCRHIGGIGMMRHRAFELCRPVANGRFGFTEWQVEHPQIQKAWITPDMPCFSLGQIGAEPWASLAKEYIRKGWMRHWADYIDGGRDYYGWWQA